MYKEKKSVLATDHRVPSFIQAIALNVSRFRFFFLLLRFADYKSAYPPNAEMKIHEYWPPRVRFRDAADRLDAQVVLQVPPPFVYTRDRRPRRQSMEKIARLTMPRQPFLIGEIVGRCLARTVSVCVCHGPWRHVAFRSCDFSRRVERNQLHQFCSNFLPFLLI